jgi:hypothetical protein
MVGYGFECGLYRTTDSDWKWSGFGLKTDKDYRINTCNKKKFTIANNANKNYSYLQIVQNFTDVKIVVLNSITPRQKSYINYTEVKVLLRFHIKI